MKLNTIKLIVLLAGHFILIGPVWALGTAAGISINNTATVTYSIGVGPAQIISDSAAFVVDSRLDLSVARIDTTRQLAVPGQTDAVLSFTVNNTGNQINDFVLTAANNAIDPFTGTENFDPTISVVYVESGVTPGYQLAEDTATFIDELAADGSAIVYIVSSIAAAQAVGDIAALTLTAQLAQAGGIGVLGTAITTDDAAVADAPAVVQRVLADAAGDTDAVLDGQYSHTSSYEIVNLNVNLTKSVSIVGGTAVTGATLTYQVLVEVVGVGSVDSLMISDAIPANSTYVNSSITVNSATRTDGTDADNADFNLSFPGGVFVDFGSAVTAGTTHIITFQVTID